MNPLLGSNTSPDLLSFCSISSASASGMSFSVAAFMMSSVGIVFPILLSRSCIISFIVIILFLLLAGMSVAILSTSNVPVFSSNATCLKQ